jgi:hypothetical protein
MKSKGFMTIFLKKEAYSIFTIQNCSWRIKLYTACGPAFDYDFILKFPTTAYCPKLTRNGFWRYSGTFLSKCTDTDVAIVTIT